MSTIVAIVKSLVGQVFAVSLDGLKRQIFEGERVLQGEQVLTALGGEVTLQLASGELVDVASSSNWQAGSPEVAEADQAPAAGLEQALAAGFDPTTDLAATAAGAGAGGGTGGGAAGGGHSFVMLAETGQQLEATVGFSTAAPGFAGQGQGEEELGASANEGNANPGAINGQQANRAPSALGDEFSVNEDGSVSIDARSNDSDLDGDKLTITQVDGQAISEGTSVTVSNGSVTLTNGQLVFTPSANYNGPASFSYTISDGVSTSTTTVSGTVSTVNDAPSADKALSTAATEDGAAFDLDLLDGAADVDNGDVLSVSNVQGLVNGLSLNGTTLSVDPTHADFQNLALGETRDILISYDVIDGNGGVTAQTATVTLTGTNDAPTVSSALSAAASEDATGFDLDLLDGAADVDNGAVLSIDNVQGLVNGLSLNGATLSVDPSHADFQSLAAGETRDIVISYDLIDGNGGVTAQTATITITGSNDAPVIQSAYTNINGQGSITKPQGIDNHSLANAVSLDGQFVQGSDSDVSNSQTTPFVSISSTGNSAFDYYTFTVTQPGTTATFDIDYALSPSGGFDSWLNLYDANGNVLASNDDSSTGIGGGGSAHSFDSFLSYTFNQPGTYYIAVGRYPNTSIPSGGTYELQVSLPHAITATDLNERTDGSADENSGSLSASGTLQFSDVDLLDGHSVSTTLLSSVDSLGSGAAARGTLTASVADASTGDGSGRIDWNYNVNTAALDNLAAGQVLTLTYRISVNDGHGGTTFHDVTITLTGSNDAPTISSALTGAANEDTAGFDLDLLSGAADVDNGAVLSISNVQGLINGLSLNGAILSVDPSHADFQSLALGETRDIVISYDVIDGNGGVTAQTATITLTGSNDAPTVSAALSTAITEDAAGVDLDLLSGAADVDNGDVLSIDNVQGLVNGLSLNGAILSVDPSHADFQSLAAGETHDIVISYDVIDGNGGVTPQTATITLTGSNDAPTVNAALSAAASEDGAAFDLDLLSGAADVDNGAVLSISNVQGLINGLSLNGAILSVDPTHADFQSLAAGETREIVVSYDVIDGNGGVTAQTATITLTGSNDAPTVSAALSAAANEDAAGFDLDLLDGAADVDNGDVLSIDNVQGLVNGLSLNGATLSVDPTHADFQSLAAGETRDIVISYDVIDGNGGVTAQTATITLTGSNDAPTVSAALSAAANEDAAGFDLDLLDGATDVDNGAVLSISNVQGLVNGLSLNGATLSVDPSHADFQSLAAGETREIVISYDVIDGNGGVTAQTATITLTGTNDAPTVSSALVAAANEDGAAFDLDLLDGAADVDNGDVLSISNVQGLVNGLSLNGATLSVDPTHADFQSLAAGETRDIVISYDVIDGNGGVTAQTATITITGTNDLPSIAGDASGAVSEDAASPILSDSGSLTISDADSGQASFQTTGITASPGALGSLSITSAGLWTYNVANADVQYLAVGETKVETFTVLSADGSTHDVVITITGSNDAPTLSSALTAAANEDGAGFNLDLLSGAADVDNGDVLSIDNVQGLVNGLSLNGATLSVDPSHADFQNLALGETHEIVISYDVIDGNGGVTPQTATITITGSNDLPSIAGDASGAVSEDATSPTLSDSGTLTISDADSGQASFQTTGITASPGALGSLSITSAGVWTYNVANAAVQYLAVGETKVETFTVLSADGSTHDVVITLTGTNDAPLISGDAVGAVSEDATSPTLSDSGTLTISDADSGQASFQTTGITASPGALGSLSITSAGVWTYNVANADVQYLAAGATKVETFSVLSTDGTAHNVVITITGSNDAPTLSSALTAAANEDGAGFNLDLLSGAADVDNGDVLSIDNVQGLVNGLSLNGATLSVDPTHADFQSLALGETREIVISYDVIDGNGGVTPQTATITLTGTNDLPSITGDASGAVSEDATSPTLSDSGTLTISDADNGQASFQTTGITASPGALGSLSITSAGVWTYNVANAAVQYLAVGETKVETFSVLSTDGTAHNVVITITGSNDAPTLSSALTTAANEDGAGFNLDLLSGAADVDNGDVLSIDNVQGLVNGLSLNGATLSVDPSHADFQSLAAGETRDIVISYDVIDGNGGVTAQTATITVTGSNDAPTVSAALSAAANEDGAAFDLDLLDGAADVDNGDVLSIDNVQGLVNGLSLNGATLSVDPTHADFQSLAAGETREIVISYDVIDGNGGVTPQTATITLTGTNDLPSIAGDASGAVSEDAASPILSDSGTLTISDADSGQASFQTTGITASPGALGSLSITSAGVWTYNVANADVQYLAAGATKVETFSVLSADGTAHNVVITITGSNDAPTVSAALSAAANEDAAGFDLDLLDGAADVDNGDVLSIDNVQGLVNGLSLNGATLSVDPTHADFQSLALGETREIVISYDVIDGNGGVTPQTATITLTGTNDLPSIAGDASGAVSEDATSPTLSDSGTLTISDADSGQASFQTTGITASPGALGSLSITSAGVWTYNVANADVQYLAAGATKVETFSVLSTDGTAHNVVITITGSNDAPTLSSALTAAANEDGAGFNLDLLSGAADVDNGDVLSIDNVQGLVNGLSLNGATLSVDPAHADFQSLAAGETRDIVVSYQVIDGNGGVTPQTATITITGTNDAPLIQTAYTNVNGQGAISKPQATDNHSIANAIDLDGQFVLGTDPDVADAGSVPFVSISAIGNNAFDYYAFTVTQAGTATFDIDYGMNQGVSFDPWLNLYNAAGTLLAQNDDANIGLGGGGSIHSYDSFLSYSFSQPGTYYIAVGRYPNAGIPTGGTYELQVSLPHAITATDLSERIDGSADENTGSLNASGSLLFSDVDLLDGHSVSSTLLSSVDSLGSGAAARGTLTASIGDASTGDGSGRIDWSYNVDNAALDNLAAGQVLTLVYRISVADGHGGTTSHDVTITLTGTNDAPTVSAISRSNSEDDASFSLDLLSAANAQDVDTGASLSVTGYSATINSGILPIGALSLAADGRTLTVDPTAFNFLSAGETRVITVSYSVSDGTTSVPNTATLTITGTNDVPVARADSAVVNEGASVIINLAGNDSDADDGLNLSSIAIVSGPANGTLTVNANGTVSYQHNGSETSSDSFTYTIKDASGATSNPVSVSVGVNPINDAPVNSLPSYIVNEDTPLKLSGLSVTDADATSGAISVTLAVASGTLSAANGSGVTVSGSGTGTVVLSGTVADINAYLAAPASQPTYVPVANASGAVTLSMTSNDLGNSGAGGALSDSDTSTITITPVADAVPGSDVSLVIGSPLTNSISFTNSSALHGLSSYTFGNGITISTGGNGTFNWSNGNDVGVNGPGDNGTTAQRIEGNEAITFNFPSGMQYMALQLKNAGDDTVLVRSGLEVGDLPNGSGTISGAIASSGGTVSSSNAKVSLVLEVLNGGITSTVTLNGTVSSGGAWTVSYSGVTGTITKATVVSTIDGDLFNQGGNTLANVTYSISTDMQSLSIAQDTSNTFSSGQNNNGFQIEYIAVDANQSGQTSYSYPVDLYAAVQDQVGTVESFTSLVLSELPAGSTISVVGANGSYQEITPNAQGEYNLSAYTSLLNTATTTSGTDKIYLSTSSALPSGFSPTLTLEVSDGGSSTAKTIIGGSANSTFTGGAGNDYISGGAGSDNINGGAGNDKLDGGTGSDLLIGGAGDDILFGGTGADSFVWQAGNTGSDVIKDLNFGEGDRIDLHQLLQGENDGNILNYLRVDTATSTLLISSTGVLNADGSNADASIKLENGGAAVNLNPGNLSQADLINSLIAGADPLIKTDHI